MHKETHSEQPSALRSAFSTLLNQEPRVELTGSREVLIEGSTGVLYYSAEAMRIGLGRQTLLLLGSELTIRAMFGRTLAVVGHIRSIEYI